MGLSVCHFVPLCVLRSIVQCEEKLTISASWSKDEDISRLLQSLPNWANMAQPRQNRQKREDEEDFTRYTHKYTVSTHTHVLVLINVELMCARSRFCLKESVLKQAE